MELQQPKLENLSDDTDNSSDYDSFLKPSEGNNNKKKKRIYNTHYNAEWELEYNWIARYRPKNTYAKCLACLQAFSISQGGRNDVKRHMTTLKHRKNMPNYIRTNGMVDSSAAYDDSLLLKGMHLTTYKPEWEDIFFWIQPVKDDPFKAHCKLCYTELTIKYRGRYDCRKHEQLKKHQNAIKEIPHNERIQLQQKKEKFEKEKTKKSQKPPEQQLSHQEDDHQNQSDKEDGQNQSKRPRRLQRYKKQWEEQYDWLKPAKKDTNAICKMCNKEFSVEYRGIHALFRHSQQVKHMRREKYGDIKLGNLNNDDDDDEEEGEDGRDGDENDNNSGVDDFDDSDHDRNYEPPDTNDSIIIGTEQNTSKNKKKNIVKKTEKNNSTENEDDNYNDNDDDNNKSDEEITSALYWDSFMTKNNSKTSIKSEIQQLTDETMEISYENNDQQHVQGDDDQDDENIDLPPQRKRTLKKFSKNWEREFEWIRECKVRPSTHAYCMICDVSFSIEQKGINDINRHKARIKHRKYADMPLRPGGTNGWRSLRDLERAEITHVYHGIMHYQGNDHATSCVNSLFGKLFPDSRFANEFNCTKLKKSRLIRELLAPITQKATVADLADNHPFSIVVNTSNRGHLNTFPLIARYYKPEIGVCEKLITYFTPNHSTETALDLTESLVKELETIGLSITNVTAYVADNTNINFGITESIFTGLTKLKTTLLPMNCLCLDVQNSVRHAKNCFKFDMEHIIFQLFNELCSTTIDLPFELWDLYKWTKEEWPKLLARTAREYLSIIPAAEKFLLNFTSLKLLFLQMENCPKYLYEFLQFELAECYLGLFQYIGQSFETTVCRLEKTTLPDDISKTPSTGPAIDLYDAMNDLCTTLQLKRDEGSYGAKAKEILQTNLIINEQQLLIQEFQQNAFNYLDTLIKNLLLNFDVQNTNFQYLSIMKLTTQPTVENFSVVVQVLHINNVNEKSLIGECRTLSTYWQQNRLQDSDTGLIIRWWTLFLNRHQCPNLEKICNFVFSIPISQQYAESICIRLADSLNSQQTKINDDRLTLADIKAELLIKEHFGYKMNCCEFYEWLDDSVEGVELMEQMYGLSNNK